MRKLAMGAGSVAALLLAGTVACSSIGKSVFKEPVVTLQDVRLNGVGLTGGSMDVILNVYNPNGYNLSATQMTYNLMVDSVKFADGLVQQRFDVAERDSNTVRIPVSFTYSGIGEAGRQLLNTGSINYRVVGGLTVATPLGNFTVPYDRTGRFSALGGTR